MGWKVLYGLETANDHRRVMIAVLVLRSDGIA